MKRLNRRATVCAVVLVAAAIIIGGLPSDVGADPTTENVIVVVIDGLRCYEAFHSSPACSLVKFMRDSLAPKGALYRNFWNRGVTQTCAGHLSIATGTWQLMPNGATYFGPGNIISHQPDVPTFWEYYSKANSLHPDSNRTYYVGGKGWKGDVASSLDPEYGEDYGANVRIYPPSGDTSSTPADTATYRTLIDSVLVEHRPHLVLANFKDVDKWGHRAERGDSTGDTTHYHTAIQVADSLVWELWDWIENDTVTGGYSGKTTLIVTTDHGRDDDDHGGFFHHGGICHGCRHMFLIAVGPDTDSLTVVTDDFDQIDICPTVGELLGFYYPKARGRVLDDMLTFTPTHRTGTNYGSGGGSEQRLTSNDSLSVSPQVASSHADTAHVVFVDDRAGEYEVYYSRTTNGGTSWSGPTCLSGQEGEIDAQVPSICLRGDTVHVVWMGYTDDGTKAPWSLMYRRSTNKGASWGTIRTLYTSHVEGSEPLQNPSRTFWDPQIAHDGESVIGITGLYGVRYGKQRVICFYSTNGGATWDTSSVDTDSNCPLHSDIAVEAAGDSNWAFCAWYDLKDTSNVHIWGIYFSRSWDGGANWTDRHPLSEASTYVADPTVVTDVPHVGVSWAHYASGTWQTYFRRSEDRGASWASDTTLSSSTDGAIDPELVLTTDSRYYDLWADYDYASAGTTNAEIVYVYSTNSGSTWSDTTYRFSDGASYSLSPSASEHKWVVWEDYRHGNWEIFVKRIGGGGGPSPPRPGGRPNRFVFALRSGRPNPFTDEAQLFYSLPEKGRARLALYNATGQLVRVLVDCSHEPGVYTLAWDGRDDNQAGVASGIYFCRLAFDPESDQADRVATRKVVRLR